MKKTILIILICVVTVNFGISQRLQVIGKNIISTEGDTVILKGFNWGWWGLTQQGDAEAACSMGANVIRMPIRWYFGNGGNDQRDTTQPGNINPEGLAILDQQIQWCVSNHLWVILFAGADRGAGDDPRNFWTDTLIKQQFFDMWQFLADRYKNTPYIAAYELLSEPHPKNPVTNAQLRSFYKELADSIRLFDPVTPIMIGANDHYDINLMDSIYMAAIPNLFYTFNFYLPTDYVKPDKRIQELLPVVSYPSTYIDFDGNTITLDKSYLNQLLQIGVSFRNTYNVPVFINQVAARAKCPNYLEYTSDVLDLFNENKIGYTYWTWRTTSDSTEHGLYWQDSVSKQFLLKQNLYNLLDQKLGSGNYCAYTSVFKAINNSEFNVFPNPAKDELNLVSPSKEDASIEISNIVGQIKIRKVNQSKIDISCLTSGIYIITIKQKGSYYSQKFIKQ